MSGLYVELFVFTVARVRPLIGLRRVGRLVLYILSQLYEIWKRKWWLTLIAKPLLLRSPQDFIFANFTGCGEENNKAIHKMANRNYSIY